MKNFQKEAPDFALSLNMLGTVKNTYFCSREILLKKVESHLNHVLRYPSQAKPIAEKSTQFNNYNISFL